MRGPAQEAYGSGGALDGRVRAIRGLQDERGRIQTLGSGIEFGVGVVAVPVRGFEPGLLHEIHEIKHRDCLSGRRHEIIDAKLQ